MVLNNHENPVASKKTVRLRLKEWFKGVAGSSLLDIEKNVLDEELPDLFGYHILQLGTLEDGNFLGSSRISHRVLCNLTQYDPRSHDDLVCHSTHLPIDANSVDVVLLPHVLEFEEDPHDILREVERILIGEGHLLILGFNPFSLWGLWHLLLAWRDAPPWNGHFYTSNRVRDWLSLLGFEVIKTRHLFFRPPTRSNWIMKRLTFMEKLGNYLWPWFGGVYLIIGKKRLIPLTPTKTEWRIRRRLIASGVTEPTTRARQLFRKTLIHPEFSQHRDMLTIHGRIVRDSLKESIR